MAGDYRPFFFIKEVPFFSMLLFLMGDSVNVRGEGVTSSFPKE